MKRAVAVVLCLVLSGCPAGAPDGPLEERIEHHFVDNEGVKIHYVTLGEGPLVVLVHGFPDFWYTWHRQFDALAEHHRVAALDLRGYNKSDKPEGVEHYTAEALASDVASVIRACGEEKAIVIGHDWGGMVAWHLATYLPDFVDRLVVLNAPNPRALERELATNKLQRMRSNYAQQFMKPGAVEFITSRLESFAKWAKSPEEKARHIEGLKASDPQAMVNYYLANYPRPPYEQNDSPIIKVKAPVLMIDGLEDQAFAPANLDGAWQWSERELTLVTVPGAGHWVQHDAPETVTRTIIDWLED